MTTLDSFLQATFKDQKGDGVENFFVNTIKEVQKRVLEAEDQMSLSQEKYQDIIQTFFDKEFGL